MNIGGTANQSHSSFVDQRKMAETCSSKFYADS